MRARPPLLAVLALLACRPAPPPDPKILADGHYLRGQEAAANGEPALALAAFDEVARLSPDDPRLPAARGEVLLSMGRLTEAEEAFQEAVQKVPTSAPAWTRLGFIRARLGRADEAKAALERALRLDPEDANALEQLGELALARGAHAEAAELFVRAGKVSADTADPAPYLRAAEALAQGERPAEAVKVLGAALAAGARPGQLNATLARLHLEAGRLEPALEDYRAAGRALPKDPVPFELAGHLAMRLGRFDEAARDFAASLAAEPRATVHLALAELWRRRGDLEKARAELDRAIAQAQTETLDAPLTRELADGLWSLGREEDGLRLLAQLASEPEGKGDVALQQEVARRAAKLGRDALVAEACGRVRAEKPKARCP